MILRASTAPWHPPARGFRLSFALVLSGIAVAALLGALYLGGFVFLLLIRSDPRAATPLTLMRYAYYYGQREDVRIRLAAGAAAGVLLVLSPGFACCVRSDARSMGMPALRAGAKSPARDSSGTRASFSVGLGAAA